MSSDDITRGGSTFESGVHVKVTFRYKSSSGGTTASSRTDDFSLVALFAISQFRFAPVPCPSDITGALRLLSVPSVCTTWHRGTGCSLLDIFLLLFLLFSLFFSMHAASRSTDSTSGFVRPASSTSRSAYPLKLSASGFISTTSYLSSSRSPSSRSLPNW
ncbi:hypothetical protein AcW1_009538 [Taiwanofungus camphoratus]|nr:hypothetical protein AcV5_002561 [Antrodia cinnamomea]KAI0947895.1 hypothetical protein AcW1_009538 [Antrodia cinnamomea]